MKKLSTAQRDALRAYADDLEAPDYAEYADRAGSLGWINRERVIDALMRKGLIDREQKITAAGLAVLRDT